MKKANLTIHFTIGPANRQLQYCARLLFILLICNSIPGITFSQQGNIWYFGNRAGLSFNTNPPSALLDGQLATYEGCATICDNNGRLLFYTDGVRVWNKQHQLMPNGTGLKGDISSTNSAIIIPRPGSATIFYVFTAGAIESNNEGYFFSEVDISLNGGLGDVTGNKNISLYTPSTEKLTAVRHSNGTDVWVITKALGNTNWKVFKIDCNGVNTTPVISSAGAPPIDFWKEVNVGCIKTSPDGTKIAAVNTAEDRWELFEFDASTGIVSNGLAFAGGGRPYGIEFSPDSKLVYMSNEWLPPANTSGGVFQYNLATYDAAIIESTKTLIGTSIEWTGALQLGPDNKIYCTLEWLPNLAVINAPNVPGMACNFVDHQVDLEEDRFPFRGLPVFFPGLITHKNAEFNYTIDADCNTVNFSANTTIVAGNISWQWDFGDGTTGTGQQTRHTYTANGPETDTVTLTVTSTGSCGSATAVKRISLNPGRPLVKFGFVRQCGYLGVTFHDSSAASSNPIQNWLWDFGDGTTSNKQHPTHTFGGFGTYTVQLTIGTPGSCNAFASVQKEIVVEAAPVADFSYTKTCINQPVAFTDESAIAVGNISQRYWDFGNGKTSTLQNPQATFTNAGSYEIKLVTRSTEGCTSDTVKKTIVITNLPVAGFNAANGCENKNIILHDAATTTGGTIASWYWDLGNGHTAIEQNPVTSYPAYGSYIVKQVVVSADGCISDTATNTIRIESTPVAGISAVNGCEEQSIAFKDVSSTAFGAVATWNWQFGDGNTAVVQNPAHAYTTPNNYTVKLWVQSTNGCTSDTVSKNISVEALPNVTFTSTEACIGKQIQFTNNTSVAFGTITGYTWNFGDGAIATINNPVHNYNQYRNFTTVLKAVTQNGCTATATRTFVIEPVHAFAGNDTTIASGQPLQLLATGGKDYLWSPPDFLNKNDAANPIAILEKDQHYQVKITTQEGCIDFDDINIHVMKGPDIYVPNAFTPAAGKNKVFRPILAGIQELYYFSVYNRWGQLIFTTREPGKGWDGTINGTVQPTGTFTWMLRAKDYVGHVIIKNGAVLLLR